MMHEQIIKLFTSPRETMFYGLWYSGVKGEGEHKEWHRNGQLSQHCFYKNNYIDGEYKRWHENGQLETERNYKNGRLDGEFKMWNNKGKLIKSIIFKDGVEI